MNESRGLTQNGSRAKLNQTHNQCRSSVTATATATAPSTRRTSCSMRTSTAARRLDCEHVANRRPHCSSLASRFLYNPLKLENNSQKSPKIQSLFGFWPHTDTCPLFTSPCGSFSSATSCWRSITLAAADQRCHVGLFP